MFSTDLQTRFTHTFYSLSIVLTAYFLGALPEKFYLLHVAKTTFYLLARFFSFKKRGFHYYMCDYCYFVNLFSLYVALVDPENLTFQKLLFVAANGPLALSVILFKNRVVFHSADQNTSVFIHVSSMLMSYCYRWNTPHLQQFSNESWLSFVMLGFGFYMLWSIVYGIVMYVILRDHILSKGNMTMFDWAIKNTKLSALKNITTNEKTQQLLYSVFHGILVSIALLISPIFWYYQWLHFAYVLFIIANAFWNGSSYYVRLENIKNEEKKRIEKLEIEASEKNEKLKEE